MEEPPTAALIAAGCVCILVGTIVTLLVNQLERRWVTTGWKRVCRHLIVSVLTILALLLLLAGAAYLIFGIIALLSNFTHWDQATRSSIAGWALVTAMIIGLLALIGQDILRIPVTHIRDYRTRKPPIMIINTTDPRLRNYWELADRYAPYTVAVGAILVGALATNAGTPHWPLWLIIGIAGLVLALSPTFWRINQILHERITITHQPADTTPDQICFIALVSNAVQFLLAVATLVLSLYITDLSQTSRLLLTITALWITTIWIGEARTFPIKLQEEE